MRHDMVTPRSGSIRLSRRRALRIAATGAGTAALLAACRGSGAGTSTQSKAATGAAGKPKSGGQINVRQTTDPFDFDPTGKPTNNRSVMCYAYDSLLSFKYGPNVGFYDAVLQPGLAERWEAPDGVTFTFHLRKGAQFANLPPVNGRAVTSADAKWSMEYISRTGQFKGDKKLFPALYAGSFTGLSDIQTPDDSTVVYKFSQPLAPFLSYSAAEWNPVLAHEVYDQDGNFSKRLVGTGPFQLDQASSQKGQHWVYKKNPTYYQEGQPYLDAVNELMIGDDATALAAFQTRQLDFITNFTIASVGGPDVVKKGAPDAVILEDLAKSFLLIMGTDKPPLNDARVRKALNLSIDRDNLIKSMTGGKGQWALASAIPGYFTQHEIKQILKYDPNQAKQLLAQAGFPDGVEIEFMYPTHKYGQQLITEIQLLQSQVKQGNITLKLLPLQDADESKRQKSGDFQLDLYPNSIKAGDPDGPLFPVYYSKSGSNYGHVKDPQLDTMLEDQRREMDPAKRKQLVRKVVQYISETPWGIGLYDNPEHWAWHPYVNDFAPNFAQLTQHYTQSWLAK